MEDFGKGRSAFQTTQWTLVVAAGGKDKESLECLCRIYWFPVYAFIRCRHHDPEEAQDLTQEFFLRLLSGSFFERASSERGRFRSFLLGAVKNFLADSHDRSRSLKRGGGAVLLPFNFDTGEADYLRESQHEETPERIFERKWTRALLDRVLTNLREEFQRDGKLDFFNRLKGFLTGSSEGKYAETAKDLGMSEPALKSAIYRLRQRYRTLLREEVSSTVEDPSAVDAELRFLLQSIATGAGALDE